MLSLERRRHVRNRKADATACARMSRPRHVHRAQSINTTFLLLLFFVQTNGPLLVDPMALTTNPPSRMCGRFDDHEIGTPRHDRHTRRKHKKRNSPPADPDTECESLPRKHCKRSHCPPHCPSEDDEDTRTEDDEIQTEDAETEDDEDIQRSLIFYTS